MAKTPIVLTDLRARDFKRGGHVYEGKVDVGHHAEIVPGESITLFGMGDEVLMAANTNGSRVLYTKAPYRKVFKIGDLAEYHSYNLVYLGRIVSITVKGVMIEDDGKRYRLDVHGFSTKNRDFDLERIQRRNADTSMAI